MLTEARVLLITRTEAECRNLERVLGEYVILRTACDLRDLEAQLQSDNYDAVFCGWSFHQGSWEMALERLESTSLRYRVVVFCHADGEEECAEAAQTGSLGSLVSPFQNSEDATANDESDCPTFFLT